MDDFAGLRHQRPEPTPPSSEVVRRAREKLMHAIEEEAGIPTVVGRRRPVRRVVVAGLAAACAAAVVVAGAIDNGGPTAPEHSPSVVAAGPQVVLLNAANAVAASDPGGSGDVRHMRTTDAGDGTTYDVYVRPNGTAQLAKAGGSFAETDGYVPSALLADLPTDPAQLRTRMLTVSRELGLGYPGERPERALYRLATEVLPDPGVSPQVKAGVYRILAALDLEAIRARDLGVSVDSQGRRGQVVEFTFEEGYSDRLVIDRSTGALLSSETYDRQHKLVSGQVYLSSELVDQVPRTNT